MHEDMAGLSMESFAEYREIARKLFASEEEGFQYYNKYALKKGFIVRRSYVEWDKANQEHSLRTFICSRQGFRDARHMKRENRKRAPRNFTRVGCRARLQIVHVREKGYWFVYDFKDEHNHPLATPEIAPLLRSHRGVSDKQKAAITEFGIAGIRKHHIMDVLEMQYGGYDNFGVIRRDLYNFCNRYKQEIIAAGNAQTVISHLKARKERDPEFFFKFLVDGEGHLNDCNSWRPYKRVSMILLIVTPSTLQSPSILQSGEHGATLTYHNKQTAFLVGHL